MLNTKQWEIQHGKFIEFDSDNKIVLNTTITDTDIKYSNCIVISMLGSARVGKSTFINGFLSYLFQTNVSLAQTANECDHCTIGIDYISFVTSNLPESLEEIKLIAYNNIYL